MEPVEAPHAHPKHTGHRWIDLMVALTALVISGASIVVALHHGETMEKLVEAQSWPYASLISSNRVESRPVLDLRLRNAGSGPARIESFTIDYRGKRVRNWEELLGACCASAQGLNRVELAGLGEVLTGRPAGAVLLPGDTQMILAMPQTRLNSAIWERLDRERSKLDFDVCYCSVFDECYRSDLRTTHPHHVKTCKASDAQWGG